MHRNRRAIFFRAIDGDLELTWQIGELRMEGGPLTQDFGIRTRINDLVSGDTREFIRR